MDSVTDRARVLWVRSERDGCDAIVVSVEDSGPGIDSEKLKSIFDAFVTTKPHGMGLGLAICRMIISRHDGQLSASAGNTLGALFRFTLPTKPAVGSFDNISLGVEVLRAVSGMAALFVPWLAYRPGI
jgi:signal transduction histidine kinase